MVTPEYNYANVDSYLALGEDIKLDDYLVAVYKIDSALPLDKAAATIAAEQSTGTWTNVVTSSKTILEKYGAKVVEINKNENTAYIAFPKEDLSYHIGGIPGLMAIIAGNLFGLHALNGVKLIDVIFPKDFAEIFPGPRYGIEGIRKIVGTEKEKRPHLGTIIKPKIGLNPEETAQVAYEAAIGGVDFIKDDETLVDQDFCPMDERVPRVMEKLDLVKQETGRTVLYSVNITTGGQEILSIADAVKGMGANMVMVDAITAGFSAIQSLAKDEVFDLPIHVHRTMHGAITRYPNHGIDMLVFAKLDRLAGGDQLHTGTAAGKMAHNPQHVKEMDDFLRDPNFFGKKTVFPVASGGVYPQLVPENIKVLGNDLVINAGGGIHGHPDGTRAGATAMKQAIDASVKGITLEEYAKDHKELATALKEWK
ncbi:MAG: ribulose 1,5-bisphosphate carboxylase [Candidatus Diapherotrites archaeon]|nr:ribulose 1,5-bisphosphate carboxylase [Candidatus Diapherotrites archaeon]